MHFAQRIKQSTNARCKHNQQLNTVLIGGHRDIHEETCDARFSLRILFESQLVIIAAGFTVMLSIIGLLPFFICCSCLFILASD